MPRTKAAADADPVGGRVAERRSKQWILLDGNRKLLVAVASVGVFSVLVAFAVLAPTSLRSLMAENPTEPLFQAIVISVVTGVTLVVTLAQLVLSQELGTAGDQHERMEAAMAYQRDVEALVDDAVAPVQSTDFLRTLVAAAGERAATVGDAASDVSDDGVREQVERYAEDVQADAASVAAALDDARFDTFAVVSAALRFDYTEKIHGARRLREERSAELPASVRERLDDVVHTLTYFGSAREHVKTLYFQSELISLSRDIVYAAVPALLVAIVMVLYGGSLVQVTGEVLTVDVLVWITSAAVTVTLLPFLLLLAYILRIVTVTQLTLAIGPLELQETVQPGARE